MTKGVFAFSVIVLQVLTMASAFWTGVDQLDVIEGTLKEKDVVTVRDYADRFPAHMRSVPLENDDIVAENRGDYLGGGLR